MINLKKLMARRERISYSMIEADSSEYAELQEEMQEVEQEIELGTGKTIDEIEEEFYNSREEIDLDDVDFMDEEESEEEYEETINEMEQENG